MGGGNIASTDELLERELRDARAREADYRTRLQRHRTLSLKLRAHAALLRDALRDAAARPASVARLLANVARLSGQALNIDRTSIWLFDDARLNLTCRFLLVDGLEASTDGLTLPVANCPGYLAALAQSELGALPVADVWTDPRTSELGAYLRAYRVGALLDIPVYGPGALRGVVCHEVQGGPRIWQEEEIDFATDVGSLVALALEAEQRIVAESTARGTEARYQHLVESLPVTVYSFRPKTGELDYLSPKVKELGGFDAEALLAAGGVARFVEAIEPEDRALVQARLSGHIEQGFVEELIYRLRQPGGGRKWIRDNCAVVRDSAGHPVAIQGTLADITALKEAELARAEVERRYRSLLENVDLLAVILDAHGRVEFVNDCFVRLTGYTREEALGADGFDLAVVEGERTRMREDFLKGIERGAILPRFETNIRTRDGKKRRVLWTNTLLRAGDGTVAGTSSLGIDITERLELEARQLEESKLESLGRLAATVAHDFNNLLMIISGAAAEMGPGATPKQGRAHADIGVAVEQASALTKSLLAYARREEIAPVLLEADAVVASAEPIVRKLVGADLRLIVQLDAPGARVVIDPSQLRQLLMNLATNAADATRGFGQQVRLATSLVVLEADQARRRGLVTEGTFWVMSLADDGRGISKELQAQVFEPFFTTKGQGEGTGLGLAICGSIVRRAGGFISLESSPGHGATFCVHLPVVDPAAAPAPRPEAAPPPVKTAAGAVVLVVEDQEPIRNLLTTIISGAGLAVLTAGSVAAARQVLDQQRVDLIILDHHLPDGRGTQVLEHPRVDAGTKVLAMTGGFGEALGARADATLMKPFRVPELLEALQQLLPR